MRVLEKAVMASIFMLIGSILRFLNNMFFHESSPPMDNWLDKQVPFVFMKTAFLCPLKREDFLVHLAT